MHSNGYILGFAAIVTVVCSLLLSLAATSLKPLQETQVELFIKKNILSVMDLTPAEGAAAKDVIDMYNNNIRVFFVDLDGNEVDAPANPDKFDQLKEFKRFGLKYNEATDIADIKAHPAYAADPFKLAVFVREDDNKNVMFYAVPVFGKGLWSTIKGYLAINTDMNTVQGMAFYEHKETPGLGARIEEQWFTDNFKGKKLFTTSGELNALDVIKGGVDESKPEQVMHGVDGISGATITSVGVGHFIKADLHLYEAFLRKMQSKPVEEMSVDSATAVQELETTN